MDKEKKKNIMRKMKILESSIRRTMVMEMMSISQMMAIISNNGITMMT